MGGNTNIWQHFDIHAQVVAESSDVCFGDFWMTSRSESRKDRRDAVEVREKETSTRTGKGGETDAT
jgi:hypothetical protein